MFLAVDLHKAILENEDSTLKLTRVRDGNGILFFLDKVV